MDVVTRGKLLNENFLRRYPQFLMVKFLSFGSHKA